MAESNHCSVTIKNETPFVLRLDRAELQWGHFVRAAEPRIAAGKQVVAFEAAGWPWSPSGTGGLVHYRIGRTGQRLVLRFENSWAAWNPHRFEIATTPDATSTFRAVQTNRGYEAPIVTLLALPGEFRFRCGWYEAEQAMDQPFVRVEFDIDDDGGARCAESVWFDCYGLPQSGGAERVEEPAGGPGDLERAMLVASGDVSERRRRYDRHRGGFYGMGELGGFGDCAGILYGVTGVSQQIANRILYASDAALRLDPPSGLLSVPAYGVFGSTSELADWTAWSFPDPFIDNVARETGVARELHLGAVQAGRPSREVAAIDREFELLVDRRLPGVRGRQLDSLLQVQRHFLERKDDWAGQLVRHEIPVREFEVVINAAFGEMLAGLASVLGRGEFAALFGLAYEDARGRRLVDGEVLAAVYRERPATRGAGHLR